MWNVNYTRKTYSKSLARNRILWPFQIDEAHSTLHFPNSAKIYMVKFYIDKLKAHIHVHVDRFSIFIFIFFSLVFVSFHFDLVAVRRRCPTDTMDFCHRETKAADARNLCYLNEPKRTVCDAPDIIQFNHLKHQRQFWMQISIQYPIRCHEIKPSSLNTKKMLTPICFR